MKNLGKVIGVIFLVAITVCTMAACDTNLLSGTTTTQTPVAGDFDIGNLTQTAGSVTAVTITPKAGKSDGTVSNIKYSDKEDVPQESGTYDITFNVAESTDNNWKAVTGLKATGKLTITD